MSVDSNCFRNDAAIECEQMRLSAVDVCARPGEAIDHGSHTGSSLR